MLHRSFKTGKCKTSLKLAVARIKLLKNKREVQLKQMKKELAQLLEAGQERTARIRVEHVEREEKTMAAYDLIEIYCELIAARLPIIESQKNCPIDLKEAIASVVFAAPRCSDIPELSDVRKHFTAKYGKEFITSALELRPECGVSRMMVEKLSARAPDGETKIKLLTSIAQEYNVKWDPKDFTEKELKPAEDLLNGPNTFQAASNVLVVNPPSQLPHNRNPKYESSVDFQERNAAESARSSQNFEHAYSTMRTSPPEPRTSVNAAEGRASGSSSSKEQSAFPLNRQNWSMEFKDATSAAQAAAESAERASIAARAAAELSSIGRIARKNSTGSQEPFVNNYSDDMLKKSTGPMSKTQHIDDVVDNDDLVRTSSRGVDPRRTQEEQRYRNRTANMSRISDSTVDVDSTIDRRANNSAQFGSRTSFPDDDKLVNNLQKADVYSQNTSFGVDATNHNWHTDKTEKYDFHGEERMEKQSSEFVVDPLDRQQNRQKTEDNMFGKQTDRSATISHETGTGGDTLYSKLSMNGSDGAGHSSSIGQGNMQISTKQPSFNNYTDAVFDDSGSDDDCNLDAERAYGHHEFNFYGSSSDDRKPPSHISEHIRSPRRQGSGSFTDSSMHSHFATEPRSSSEYPESPKEAAVPLQSREISATFDDSDGLYSDSDEEDANNVKFGGKTDLSSRPLEHTALTRSSESLQINRIHGAMTSTSKKKEATGSNKKSWLHSSSDDSECYDVNSQSDLEAKLYVGGPAQEKQGHLQSSSFSLANKEVKPTDDFLNTQSSKEFHSPVVEDKMQPPQSSRLSSAKELKVRDDVNAQGLPDNIDNSKFSQALSSEFENGLNLGRLAGGFRNKGYIRPPYNKGPSRNASSQSREQSDEGTSAVTEKPTVRSVIGTSMNSGALHQEQYNQKHVVVQGDRSTRTPKTVFDSDSDNETEVSPPKTVGSSGYSRPGLSRRTRDSPKQLEVNSLPRFTSYSERGKPSISYDSKPVSKPQNERVQYGNTGESSLRTVTSEEYSKPQSQTRNTQNSKLTPDITVGEKSTKALPQNEVATNGESSEFSRSSSVVKQPSVLHSSATSRDTKTPKAPSLREDSASRENSLKKAGHVHPKLPDYDTFAAHFESLRSNRRSG